MIQLKMSEFMCYCKTPPSRGCNVSAHAKNGLIGAGRMHEPSLSALQSTINDDSACDPSNLFDGNVFCAADS